MTHDDGRIPEFLREAIEVENELDAPALDALSALPELLTPAHVAGRGRLLAAVEVLPRRYAPFFDRLALLWDLSEKDLFAALERAALASAWRKPGLPGLRVVDVSPGPRLRGARVTLACFSAGMRFPAHRHLGPEALFVLEGAYEDQSGRMLGPGDLHEMPDGSEHFFKVQPDAPCVAASVQFGMEFTGTVMRILTRIFG
jgi:quercetin dioxygenase-like cupin family protein